MMGIIKTQLIWNPRLLGKCFMVNTSLYHKYCELYIIWDNLECNSWRLHIQSYLSTHPLRVFIFYLFFNQNKIKWWKKDSLLMKKKITLWNNLMDHSSHVWWSPHTWRLTCCKRDGPWDNLIRKFSYR